MNIQKPIMIAALAALAAPAGMAIAADSYPNRPIRLIVPFPPGGSNDIVGRMIAAQLGERLGKQMVVDNRGGAGGTIGTETVVRSTADGYTLLIISVAYAYNPALYKLNFDPINAITPLSIIGTGPNVLVVHPALPASSVKELIALAKAKPGQLNYASAGVGTFQHLSSELFRIMAGVDIVHVPFKGGGPAMLSVISGETKISIGSLIQTLPHIRSGRFRVLGVGGSKHSVALPDAPTIAEAGVPGYDANNWWGLIGPAGLAPAVVKKLQTEMAAILNAPETQKWFLNEGAEVVRMTSGQFAQYIVTETAKWGKVVRTAGIRAE
jgi:tripartite-type tricarboxylate transporter receptor subunit TctC